MCPAAICEKCHCPEQQRRESPYDTEKKEEACLHIKDEEEEPAHPHNEEEEEKVSHKKEEAEPQLSHVKEEEQEVHITKFLLTVVHLKSDGDDERQGEENGEVEPPSSSSAEGLGDHGGGSRAESLLAPLSDSDDILSQSLDTEDEQSKRDMKWHTDNAHWKCLQCEKTFCSKWGLKVHTRTHTGEKLFPCLVCGKSFTVKSRLTAHTRTHTGEKPFPCSVCGNSFSTKSGLNKHTRTHW